MPFGIRPKLLYTVGAGLFLIILIIYLMIDRYYYKNLESITINEIQESERLINEHISFDTEKLSAITNMFIAEDDFKPLFIKRDREGLYKKCLPLYTMLNQTYNVTHFYFHLPDGTNFLRVHNKELHGDNIARETFKTAAVTGKESSGIELGKTSFALRVVAPYHYNNKLIGYVEFGEEIDHFVDFLKRTTHDDYALLAEKELLSKDEWTLSNKTRGIDNKWDLMPRHAWISRQDDKFIRSGCVTEENIKQFEYGPAITPEFRSNAGDLVCGGFPLYDIQRKHIGAIATLINTSKQARILSEQKIYFLTILSAISLLIFVVISLISDRWIVKPIENLANATRYFAKGDLKNHRITHHSGDELGLLSEAINDMAAQLDTLCSSAETRSSELEALNRKLETLAITDGLTGLYNHRYFYNKIAEEIHRSNRYNHPLSLIIADIDNLKSFNDTYGHTGGDSLLKTFAETIKATVRDTDIVARYGGDEFALLLPETDLKAAMEMAERIRSQIHARSYFQKELPANADISASFGVAEFSLHGESEKELVKRADKALYEAKKTGRNRVVSS